MAHQNRDQPLFKLALLSLSSILAIAPSLGPAIPEVAKHLPGVSAANIEMLVTIPNLGIMIFVLVSGFFASHLGEKRMIMLGLLVATVAGLAPLVTNNYFVILSSRFLLGAGIGLVNPLAYSLLNILYTSNESATLLGYANAITSLCGAVTAAVAGYLALINWHATFLIYLLVLLPLGLFALAIPRDFLGDAQAPAEKAAPVKTKTWVGWPVLLLAVGLFLFYALLFALYIKVPTALIENRITTPGAAGLIVSSFTIAAMVVSLGYGQIYRHLGHYTILISMLGVGITMMLLAESRTAGLDYLISACSGVFFASTLPYAFMLGAQISPAHAENLTSSILLIGINLGVFLSPYLFNLMKLIHPDLSANTSLPIAGMGIVLLGLAFFFASTTARKKAPVQ